MTLPPPTASRTPRDDVAFAARMTALQLEALACRLAPDRLKQELTVLITSRPISPARNCSPAEVTRWLQNGWSTEHILTLNARHLSADGLGHSLHWAFPQAYYSVYAVMLAYFKAVGFTETTHASTIKKFGLEVLARHYPPSLSCLATGGSTQLYHGLACTALPTSLHFIPADPATVDGQIAQFLRATRRIDLNERKTGHKLTTKRGTRKKAFSQTDWSHVARALGATSIMSLLYRKRIKANYRDIDSFLHPALDAPVAYNNILRIVQALNISHEVYIARALGLQYLHTAIATLPREARERPAARIPTVRNILG